MTSGGRGSMSGVNRQGGLDGGVRAQVGSQDAIAPQTIQPLVPGSLEWPELGTVSASPEVEGVAAWPALENLSGFILGIHPVP